MFFFEKDVCSSGASIDFGFDEVDVNFFRDVFQYQGETLSSKEVPIVGCVYDTATLENLKVKGVVSVDSAVGRVLISPFLPAVPYMTLVDASFAYVRHLLCAQWYLFGFSSTEYEFRLMPKGVKVSFKELGLIQGYMAIDAFEEMCEEAIKELRLPESSVKAEAALLRPDLPPLPPVEEDKKEDIDGDYEAIEESEL